MEWWVYLRQNLLFFQQRLILVTIQTRYYCLNLWKKSQFAYRLDAYYSFQYLLLSKWITYNYYDSHLFSMLKKWYGKFALRNKYPMWNEQIHQKKRTIPPWYTPYQGGIICQKNMQSKKFMLLKINTTQAFLRHERYRSALSLRYPLWYDTGMRQGLQMDYKPFSYQPSK